MKKIKMETPNDQNLMKIIRIFLWLLIIAGASGCGASTEKYTVMKGVFRLSFIETGELDAISSVAIMVPRIRWEYGYEYKLIGIAETGKYVKEGDTVVQLDPSAIEKIIISKEEALENEKAASKKQLVKMENNIQELKAQLRTEEAMYDLKKLELERSKFDAEKNRGIKELEFRQATIRLEKIKRQIEQKPVMDNYDYRIQKIKEKQVEAELEGAREALKKMVITSPRDGMFQGGNSEMYWPPRSLKPGDRIWIGQMVAKIPDINRMKVRTFVNETDITKISKGMKVVVRLDALPEIAFHGRITEVGLVCVEKDKKKVFRVVVEITESDLRLKPGMTVGCEFISMEADDALYIPNNCLLMENGKTFVFAGKLGRPVKTEVQTGPSNSNHTLILEGVSQGEPLTPCENVLKNLKH